MFRSKATLPLLATFFFVTTVALDAISHMHVHDNHGHEYECPFSNNKVIESDLSDPIKRVEFSPILVAEFTQKYYHSTTKFSFESRAPPKI